MWHNSRAIITGTIAVRIIWRRWLCQTPQSNLSDSAKTTKNHSIVEWFFFADSESHSNIDQYYLSLTYIDYSRNWGISFRTLEWFCCTLSMTRLKAILHCPLCALYCVGCDNSGLWNTSYDTKITCLFSSLSHQRHKNSRDKCMCFR